MIGIGLMIYPGAQLAGATWKACVVANLEFARYRAARTVS